MVALSSLSWTILSGDLQEILDSEFEVFSDEELKAMDFDSDSSLGKP